MNAKSVTRVESHQPRRTSNLLYREQPSRSLQSRRHFPVVLSGRFRRSAPWRSLQGQTRHMYLVMLAYSLLMSQLRQGRACELALHRLTTIGEACRAMLRENLRTTLAWVIEQVTEKERPFDHVVAQLGLS